MLGGPCEGCDWVFDSMPATLSSTARIAPAERARSPLVIEGVVRTPDGKPARASSCTPITPMTRASIRARTTGMAALRGWARTDAHGRYRFDTIRPRAYPGRDVPEHVHMHVIEPGKGTYYIDELRFEDDPLMTSANRAPTSAAAKDSCADPR